jgi:galactose-1-phosphate uridylyltransferase
LGKNDTEIIGLNELLKAIAQLPDEAMKDLTTTINQDGAMLADKVSNAAPYGEGTAQRNIVWKKATNNSKYPYRIFGRVTFKQAAAHIVPLELGHKLIINGKRVRAIKECPFMRTTADKEKENYLNDTIAAMNNVLERWGG